MLSTPTVDDLASQKLWQEKALKFLKGSGRDDKGRKVDDYLEMTEQQMENDHTWIQWAFPISTISVHNPNAGRIFTNLNPEGHFKDKSPANFNRRALLDKYLESIGISWTHAGRDPFSIDLHKFFSNAGPNSNPHHMKRISRVMKHMKMTEIGWNPHYTYAIYRAIMTQAVQLNPRLFNQETLYIWASINGGFDT